MTTDEIISTIVCVIVFTLVVVIAVKIDKNYEKRQHGESYEDLLKRPEWKAKREHILKIQGYRCCNCGATRYLQVHHRYYCGYSGGEMVKPWDYPDDAFKVLCDKCHKEEHQLRRITTYYRSRTEHYDM